MTKTLGSGDQDTYLKSCMVKQEANRSISDTLKYSFALFGILRGKILFCVSMFQPMHKVCNVILLSRDMPC